jgi:putative copper export protein
MMWVLILIQWLHVLLGMFWFGSTLCLDVVVIPAVMTLPLEQQRSVSKLLTRFSERVIIPAAILVILLGLVRGTIFGPVRSLDFLFGTAYGLTFLFALLATLATLAWGLLVSIEQPGDSIPFHSRK